MEDREKLTKLLLPMVESELAGDCSSLVRGWVDYLIANGVTIPVRCKDCKHRDEYGCCKPPIISSYGWDHLEPKDNDYCSYGERKTDDNRTEL